MNDIIPLSRTRPESLKDYHSMKKWRIWKGKKVFYFIYFFLKSEDSHDNSLEYSLDCEV